MNKCTQWTGAAGLWLLLAAAACAGPNLLANGSFDDPEDPLKTWRFKYDLPGESWYAENHTLIDVVPREGNRRSVLRMHGTREILFDPGWGVKVDSKAVPYEYGAKYKLSMWIRSQGSGNRIYIIGYQWKPGIKPHPDPELYELRNIYKGKVLFPFGGSVGKTYRSWTKGTGEFPGDDLSEAAKKHLKKVRFISVHIVSIICGGNFTEGDFFVDDVVLKKDL